MNRRKTQRPINAIIEGVRKSEQKAVEDLWVFLRTEKAFYPLKKRGLAQEAADIFFVAFEAFCSTIREEKFKPRGDTEKWRENQTKAFFDRMIIGAIKKFPKPSHELIENKYLDELQPEYKIQELSLVKKTLELIHKIGNLCSKILTRALVYGKSNKEIAKLKLDDNLLRTKDVTEKKKECLNKLYINLINNLSDLSEEIKGEYIEISMEMYQQQGEPCHAIIQLHFSGKSNEEIANDLQDILPLQEARKLQTKDQVKHKKSRCLNAYREMIMQEILKRQKT